MATHSGIVAWKILGPKEPGGLQFMATVHHKKIGHDLIIDLTASWLKD